MAHVQLEEVDDKNMALESAHGPITYAILKSLATLLRTLLSIYRPGTFRRISRHDGRSRHEVPSRDQGRSIIVHIYHPPEMKQTASNPLPTSKLKPSPVLINWHGSGFVIPAFAVDTRFCDQVSREAGIVVIDADYRKAPEHPWPAAIHDVEDVVHWVLSQPDKFDAGRIAVSGFSAGANLALVAASSLDTSWPKPTKDEDKHVGPTDKFQAVIAFYPPSDLAMSPKLKKAPKPIFPIPSFLRWLFDSCYIPPKADKKDPRISPSYADEGSFPNNVLIISCEGDILCLEAEALAGKLMKRGSRHVVQRRMEGVPHAWDKAAQDGTPGGQRRDEAYTLAVELLRKALRL